MMKKLILFLGLTLIASCYLLAQHGMKQKDDWIQKIKSEKVAYLTTELQLSPEEAQNFWPVYNEFDKKRFEIHMQRRHMEHNTMEEENIGDLNEQQLKKIATEFISLYQKEADLMKEYKEKFLTVLPAKKVVMFYDVENDFRSRMLKVYKQRKEKEN